MPFSTLPRRRLRQGAVAGVCLLGGVLFGTAHEYSQGQDIRPRNVELSALIQDAQAKVVAAESVAASLQSSIDAAAAGDLSPRVEQVRSTISTLEPSAALTAVTGPGLSVTLTDAPRDSDGNYPADANPDDLVVHQQDVQAVVNAMWAGGAEAMMIMDQRVIATSAVRCIGNTLLLMGRAYSPPFVVTAIGPAETMQSALDGSLGVALFREYVNRYDLGFEVAVRDTVTVPGYDGLVRMTAATTVGG